MRYFTTPGAGLAYREDPDWAAPANWRPITEDAYNARKVVIDQAAALRVEEVAEENRAVLASDFAELISVGVSERVARRLTGHRGETVVADVSVNAKGGKS